MLERRECPADGLQTRPTTTWLPAGLRRAARLCVSGSMAGTMDTHSDPASGTLPPGADKRVISFPVGRLPFRPGGGAESSMGRFKSDFLASLVVFLVALPLCMGIANACGLPPAQGILTGIIGGLLVAALAGCPLQVSGPAAGLVVTVTEIVRDPKLGVGML